VSNLSANGNNTSGTDITGRVYLWGVYSEESQALFGNSAPEPTIVNTSVSGVFTPIELTDIVQPRQVVLGEQHGCALLETGQVACWGNNDRRQLGIGDLDVSLTPVLVPGVFDAIQVDAAIDSCALLSNGTVTCWGRGCYGLGQACRPQTGEPYGVSGLTEVVQISLIEDAACGLRKDGSVYCWGDNQFGQLGNGTLVGSASPVQVVGLTDVVAIGDTTGAEGNHFCAQRRNGNVVCWGRNNFGQLGDGTIENRSLPVTVLALP
jgi:alpha-tubulin suppressor-like RCC1 family protein